MTGPAEEATVGSGDEREVTLVPAPVLDLDTEVVAVGLGEGAAPSGATEALDRRAGGVLGRWVAAGRFRGEAGETLFVPSGNGTPHLLAVGLGKEADRRAEAVRRLAGVTIREARHRRLDSAAVVLPDGLVDPLEECVRAAAEGLVLGDWSFDELRGAERREKRPPRPGRAAVHVPEDTSGTMDALARAVREGRAVAAAQNWARGLVARPGNVATPTFLAMRARGDGRCVRAAGGRVGSGQAARGRLRGPAGGVAWLHGAAAVHHPPAPGRGRRSVRARGEGRHLRRRGHLAQAVLRHGGHEVRHGRRGRGPRSHAGRSGARAPGPDRGPGAVDREPALGQRAQAGGRDTGRLRHFHRGREHGCRGTAHPLGRARLRLPPRAACHGGPGHAHRRNAWWRWGTTPVDS